MAKKTQTPLELVVEICERETKKYLKIAEDKSLATEVRMEAMTNVNHLDTALDSIKLVRE